MRRLDNLYFTWLCETVREPDYQNYSALLRCLYEKPFSYIHPMDENRWYDGVDLRKRYCYEKGICFYLIDRAERDKMCNVLEMMAALAIRMEESVSGDPKSDYGAGRWFWRMITNLGLWVFSDSHFDRRKVNDILDRFLNRDYMPNGDGGLFTLAHCEKDLRKVEIWNQAMWYLTEILNLRKG